MSDQLHAPLRRSRRPIRFLVAATGATAVMAMGAVQHTEAAGSLTSGSTTIQAGQSTTIAVSFTAIDPLTLSGAGIRVSGGSTGSLAITSTSNPLLGINTAQGACIIGPDAGVLAGDVLCDWSGDSTTGSVTVTVTASGDASGVFRVVAIESGGTIIETGSPLEITVAPPPTTTAAPTTAAPTTAAPTTAAPTTTAAGSGGAAPTTTVGPSTLPATGPSRATSAGAIGLLLVSSGALAVVLSRRRTGSAAG